MITIEKFTCNMLQENCYVVSDKTNECVIIDCGAYYEAEKLAIEKYIKQNDLRPVHLIATHGHLDHNFGDAFITSTYGSMLMIIQSLRMFVQFPDDIRILPGHGAETTMGYELAHNPYLDR